MKLSQVVDTRRFNAFSIAQKMKSGGIHEMLSMPREQLPEHLPAVAVARDLDVNIELFCVHHQLPGCGGGAPPNPPPGGGGTGGEKKKKKREEVVGFFFLLE